MISLATLPTSQHFDADITSVNEQAVWDREYRELSSIPSSRRIAPSNALVELGKGYGFKGKRALDLGCGNGRNTIYFDKLGFSVDALDFSNEALALAKNNFLTHTVSSKARIIRSDIRRGLPYPADELDLVLDSYCTCHFIDKTLYYNSISEIARVLRSGGIYIRLHLDTNDVYYKERTINIDDLGVISYNSENGIFKRHYSCFDLTEHLSVYFNILIFQNVNFTDIVNNQPYERSISALVCVLR